jgi:hypothetical protein
MANLFGAALKATLRKRGYENGSTYLLRRPVSTIGGVRVDLPMLPQQGPSLPTIDETSDLEPTFPAEDWQRYYDHNDVWALLNNREIARIVLPDIEGRGALFLLRFYAVASEAFVFTIAFHAGDASEVHTICQSESRLLRLYVAPGTKVIDTSLRDILGALLSAEDAHARIRFGIARLVTL